MLTVRNVSKSYGANEVLSDVTLDFEVGRIYALIGPNGAGKSTLLKILSGFETPTKGEVVLAGRSLAGLSPHAIARLGTRLVFQATKLWETMTTFENLLTAQEHAGQADHKVLTDALEMIGLRRYSERLPGDLSSGQRRILSVALSLVGRPKVLLLDEPSATLDQTNAKMVFEYLRTIDRSNRIIIIVEHNLGLLAPLIDVAVFQHRGVVRAVGGFVEITERTDLRRLYLGLEA